MKKIYFLCENIKEAVRYPTAFSVPDMNFILPMPPSEADQIAFQLRQSWCCQSYIF